MNRAPCIRRPVTCVLHTGLFSNLQGSFRIYRALFEYAGQRIHGAFFRIYRALFESIGLFSNMQGSGYTGLVYPKRAPHMLGWKCILHILEKKKNPCGHGNTNSAPLFIGDFSHTRRPVTCVLHTGLFSNLQGSFRIYRALFEYAGQRLFRTCSDAIIARVLCVAIYIAKECSPIHCKRGYM